MLQRTGYPCALTMERLEEKNLLAGDVSVAVINGDVLVSGDQESNHVRIVARPMDGELVIFGLPSADGIPTTVNGQQGPVQIDGLDRNVNIRMGLGNDLVDLPAGPYQRVNVATGSGADVVRLGRSGDVPSGEAVLAEGTQPMPAVVMHSLNINTGRGPDRVLENDLVVTGDHRIATGLGADTVRLGELPQASTDGFGVRVGGDLHIQLALGPDTLRAANVQVAGNALVNGGRGNDQITLAGFASPGAVAVMTGPGADQVDVVGSTVANLSVHTGQGHDRTAILDSTFANLGVSLGDGHDRMLVGQTSVADTAVVLGGAGRDTLVLLGGNQVNRWAVAQVENFVNGRPEEEADQHEGDEPLN